MSARRDIFDWLMLATLVAMWGTSFLFNEIALDVLPPAMLVAARLVLGAAILAGAMMALRLAQPRGARTWAWLVLVAVVGNCVPYYLISRGQQSIDSGLAGILVGFMPLATLVLAHRFVPGERVTRTKIGGFLLGLVGLAVLVGPEALGHLRGAGTELAGQLACLGGALCYAANSVIVKRMPKMHALVAAAWTTLIAALVMMPVSLVLDDPGRISPDASALAACVWLGIGPTALATIVYFRLIERTGPTFMSLVNYMSPALALSAGALLLGEALRPAALVALAMILAGIALATRERAAGRK